MKEFDTEIVVSLLIILILLGLLSCTPKQSQNENKYETISKALGTIGNGKK